MITFHPPHSRKTFRSMGVLMLFCFITLTAQSQVPEQLIPDWAPSLTFELDKPVGRNQVTGRNFLFPALNEYGLPEIRMTSFRYTYDKKADQIILAHQGGAEEGYEIGRVAFSGPCTIYINQAGASLKGEMRIMRLLLSASKLNLLTDEIQGEGVRMEVLGEQGKSVLVAPKVEIKMGLEQKEVFFTRTEVEKSHFQLPLNAYVTSLTFGYFRVKEGELRLGISPDARVKDGYFYSTRPDQDSLHFFAKKAEWTKAEGLMRVASVPHLYVGESKIIPDENMVMLMPGGNLAVLSNATIETNLETRYHRIVESEIAILSSKDFRGSGKLEYKQEGEGLQLIPLQKIRPSVEGGFQAEAEVTETDDFYLFPYTRFAGTLTWHSDQKALGADGKLKLEGLGESFDEHWLAFSGSTDPQDFALGIAPEVKAMNHSGLSFVSQYRTFYATFLQAKRDVKDREVLSVDGALTLDEQNREWVIQPESSEIVGNRIRYSPEKDQVTAQGLLDFPYQFAPKATTLQMAGEWKEDRKGKALSTDLMMQVELSCIPAKAWETLADLFKLVTAVNEDIDFTNSDLQEAAVHLLPKKKTQAAEFFAQIESATYYPDIQYAAMLPQSLVFSNVDFRYDAKYKSLYCNSMEMGLVGINGESINKKPSMSKIEYCFGKVGANGQAASDTLSIFLEADELNWVYLQAYDEVVMATSSDQEGFNAVLKEKQKKTPREGKYHFRLGTEQDREQFITRFVNRYIWRS